MLTIESLKQAGADTAGGIARCANNEAFYLRMAKMVIESANFESLYQALENRDVVAMFENTHALKGTTGNVSFDQMAEPINLLTELLRGPAKSLREGGEAGDLDFALCADYVARIKKERDILKAML